MSPATLDMFTMVPRLCRLMRRRASRVQKKVPLRCTPIMRSHDSSVMSWVMSQCVVTWPLTISMMRASDLARSRSRSAAEVPAMPALLTSTSRVPSSRSISANMALTWALSATSAAMARAAAARAPRLSTVSLAARALRSLTTTRAPSAAKSWAIARPMPEPAPVMRAPLSWSFTPPSPRRYSAFDPGDHEAPAVIMADVRAEVLYVGLPGRHRAHRGAIQRVYLRGDVALDVVDDLAALGHVEGPALQLDHVGELGIVHSRSVQRLPGHEVAVEVTVGIRPLAEEPRGHLVELAEERGGDEGAVLLHLELHLDAALLPTRHGHFDPVHVVGAVAGRGLHGRLEAIGMSGLGEESPRLPRIEVEELSSLRGELIDGDGPVFEGGGHGGIGHPVAALRPAVRLEDLLPVGSHGQRAAHADVLEGLLVEMHPGDAAEDHDVVLGLEARLALLGRREIAAKHDHAVLGAEVIAPGEPGREGRGGVGVDGHVHVVDVGEARDEVVRVAHEGEAQVGLVALEHPRSRPDATFRLLEIAKLLHRFLGHDPRGGGGERVEEPGERLLHRELDGVLVHDLDLLHRLEEAAIGIGGAHEPLVAVLDVVRGHLAPIERGLVVPPRPAPQLEDVRGVVGLGPRLREIGLDGLGPRLHGRPGLDLDEAAVRERQRHHGREGHRVLRIEVHGSEVEADAEGAAALGRLGRCFEGMQQRRARGPRRDGKAAQLEQVAAVGVRELSCVHVGRSCVGQKVTGSDLSPRRAEDSRHSGTVETRLSLGKRRTRVPRAIWPSSRARGAPRQKWIPKPKAMWRFSFRVTSSRSGSLNCLGSRLAAPMTETTTESLGMRWPPISTSAVVMRPVRCTGPSKRRSSSMPVWVEAGSSRNARNWSGCWRRARSPLPIRLTVVSWPAMRRSMQVETSSGSLSLLPSSSAAIRPVRRSERGSFRRAAMRERK